MTALWIANNCFIDCDVINSYFFTQQIMTVTQKEIEQSTQLLASLNASSGFDKVCEMA